MPEFVRRFLVELLLEKAIQCEEQSYRYYESALKVAVMDDAKEILKILLAQEFEHRMRLE